LPEYSILESTLRSKALPGPSGELATSDTVSRGASDEEEEEEEDEEEDEEEEREEGIEEDEDNEEDEDCLVIQEARCDGGSCSSLSASAMAWGNSCAKVPSTFCCDSSSLFAEYSLICERRAKSKRALA